MIRTNEYNYKSWGETFPDSNVTLKNLNTNSSWKDILDQEFKSDYFKQIEQTLSSRLKETNNKVNIYPYPELIFNAFNQTSYNDLQVVILGQDPYHSYNMVNNKKIPEAMGLSFSVPLGINIPSSLRNIYSSLDKNNHLLFPLKNGNLEFWASQGCLLLNTSLTVEEKSPNCHSGHWKKFTDNVIRSISDQCDNLVFVLWGANAISKQEFIDAKRHKIIISSHPSGLSCHSTIKDPFNKKIIHSSFNDTDCFGEINKYLKSLKKKPIIWQTM